METDIDERYIRESDKVRDSMALMAIDIEEEAKALMLRFRADRTQLQLEYEKKVRHEHPELTQAKVVSKIFAPLNLHARAKENTIELYWFNTRRSRKLRHGDVAEAGRQSFFKRINMGSSSKRFHYHMPTLLAHAKPWEKELVRRTEEACAHLRARRNEVVVTILKIMDRYDPRPVKAAAVASNPGVAANDVEREAFEPMRDPMEAPAPPPRVRRTTQPSS